MNNKTITSITEAAGFAKKLLKGLSLAPALCVALLTAEVVAEEAVVGQSADAVIEAVSINSADAEALAQALQGIGVSKAQAIVEWREANGGFSSIDQLTEVKGIGAATVDKNRDKLSL